MILYHSRFYDILTLDSSITDYKPIIFITDYCCEFGILDNSESPGDFAAYQYDIPTAIDFIHRAVKDHKAPTTIIDFVKIAIENIEQLICRLDIQNMKYYLNVFKEYDMPLANTKLNELLQQEAEKRCQNISAKIIQKHWREANSNPNKLLCYKRLLNEFDIITSFK